MKNLDINTIKEFFTKDGENDLADRFTARLSEKMEAMLADLVEAESSVILEMTPGHEEMMKQYMKNISVVDYTPEDKDAKATPKKTEDARLVKTMPKQDDNQQEYSEVGGKPSKKAAATPNFVAGKYSMNSREMRSEAVEQLFEGDALSYIKYLHAQTTKTSKANSEHSISHEGKTYSLKTNGKVMNLYHPSGVQVKHNKAVDIVSKASEPHMNKMKKFFKEDVQLDEAEYNAKAVDKSIASSNRSGQKIKGKEAKLIHALLKGRTTKDKK